MWNGWKLSLNFFCFIFIELLVFLIFSNISFVVEKFPGKSDSDVGNQRHQGPHGIFGWFTQGARRHEAKGVAVQGFDRESANGRPVQATSRQPSFNSPLYHGEDAKLNTERERDALLTQKGVYDRTLEIAFVNMEGVTYRWLSLVAIKSSDLPTEPQKSRKMATLIGHSQTISIQSLG